MDIFRKLGIAVTMIIPTFVFSGLVWSWFHNWLVVFGMMILMVILYAVIISGKCSCAAEES
ncbi:MAG: hypothetical protein GY849_11440 [Deltaproteobacteria bacterium]|nr:hypothetical protein [Deltaproteobacteria bacterium]